ncbi:hypothetical protein ACWC24_39735 [Streptomyces sp. NPDC001443]
MKLRSKAVTAAVTAAAALAATGITYASAASAPAASAQAPQVAPVPQTVKAPEAAPAPQAAPAVADLPGGGNGQNGNNNSKGDEGDGDRGYGGDRGNGGHRGGGHREEGRIFINERSYSAYPDGCITVVSGLGAWSLNVRNESRRTVEVFRGAVCDNGAPVATVGPFSSSNGVRPGWTKGIDIHHGVVGSFRVVRDHYGDRGGRGDY